MNNRHSLLRWNSCDTIHAKSQIKKSEGIPHLSWSFLIHDMSRRQSTREGVGQGEEGRG